MLVQLGQRSAAQDVVDLLYECHGRIRKFLSFAAKLAAAADVSEAEAKDVAAQIRRYFALSFPLHLADEDESIAPALATETSIRATLARMHADHASHAVYVARVVEICAAIERDPRTLPAQREGLRDAAAVLALELETHLELEEREVFPALRRLPQAVRDDLRLAMRSRREAVA